MTERRVPHEQMRSIRIPNLVTGGEIWGTLVASKVLMDSKRADPATCDLPKLDNRSWNSGIQYRER